MGEYHIQNKTVDQKSSSRNSNNRTVQARQNGVAGIIQMAKTNPKMLTTNDVMVLQKTIGNQAVCQLLSSTREDKNEVIQKNEDSLQMKKENETGIPDNLKSGVESQSGLSMDDVRVHYNSDRPKQVGALAYTQGTEIHVAPGQEKHLGHELGHVVQQKQGRVKPTAIINGVEVNDDENLEREADTIQMKNDKVLNEENGLLNGSHQIKEQHSIGVTQRKIKIESKPEIVLETADEVVNYLMDNGVHVYYKYIKAAEMSEEFYGRKTTPIPESEGVQKVIGILEAYENPSVQDLKRGKIKLGAQQLVQEKLIEIFELVRANTDISGSKINSLDADIKQWYEDVKDNGLCGGWSVLHRNQPDMAITWNAIAEWIPKQGVSTKIALEDLNRHMEERTQAVIGGTVWSSRLIEMIKFAFDQMDVVDPYSSDKYGKSPDIAGIKTPTEKNNYELIDSEQDVEVKLPKLAGSEAIDKIKAKLNGTVDKWIVHIETDEHHMSVKYEEDKIIEIVESEYEGISINPTESDATQILNKGIYLGVKPQDTEISLEYHKLKVV